jgi:hypothetical protein
MGIYGFKKFQFYVMRSKAITIHKHEAGNYMSGLVFFPIFLQGRNNCKKYDNDVTDLGSQKLCITQGGDSSPVSVLVNICHHIQRLNNYHITLNKRHIFFTVFPTEKLRCLEFEELFTSL